MRSQESIMTGSARSYARVYAVSETRVGVVVSRRGLRPADGVLEPEGPFRSPGRGHTGGTQQLFSTVPSTSLIASVRHNRIDERTRTFSTHLRSSSHRWEVLLYLFRNLNLSLSRYQYYHGSTISQRFLNRARINLRRSHLVQAYASPCENYKRIGR